MSPLMRSECRKFSPNIFNKTKCSNCFRQKEEHSAEALESNRATRKACKCGYLFVAPDWDFSNPINRTKRWQRRWFVLYDDGELTYSVDEHPETVPQAAISLIGTSGQGVGSIVWEAPESETGHPHSLAVAAPDRVHFVRGDTPEETKAWLAALLAVVSPVTSQGGSRLRQARHKRNATFPGGRSNSISMGVSQRGATSFSRQASPILRQRFNSCISPLHHAYPSESDKESRIGVHPSSPVSSQSNALSSASLPAESSDVFVTEGTSETTATDCHAMPRIQVSGEVASRSYLADLSPLNSKSNDGIEVNSRSSVYSTTPTERLSSIISVEPEVKISSSSRSYRNDVSGYGYETSKISSPGSWRKYNSAAEEKSTAVKTTSPVEKTVRGDPDGCVLDSMSSSSCCSVETAERTDVLTSADQAISRQSGVKDEIDGRNVEAADDSKEVPHELLVKHGWLMKLGPSKEWSKHWFVLNGSGLLYYRDSSAEGKGILDGVIDLGLISDVRETTVERNHGIQLMTWDGKQCLLSAVTPGIRAGWIAALRRAANLPSLPLKNVQSEQSRLPSEGGGSGSISSQSNVDSYSKTSDQSHHGSSSLLNLMSSPIQLMFSPTHHHGIKDKISSSYTSPLEQSLISSPNNNDHKGLVRDSAAVSNVDGIKSSAINTPLVTENISLVAATATPSDTSDLGSSLLEDIKSPSFSSTSLASTPKFSAEDRGYEDQGAVNVSGSLYNTVNSSADSSLSTLVPSSPSALNVSSPVSSSRTNAHKPPVSPAVSSTSFRSARRHSTSLCARLSGSAIPDRVNLDHITLERNLSDSSKPERPNFLPLKSPPSSESKVRGSTGYAPVSYISSSASSCSLSDEDFRTASEASLHSTPMSELIVDNNCNSIAWSKSDQTKGETSSTQMAGDIANDLGSMLPPSPPLNRTPISRVKERARCRVVRRSKTPPEENIQSMKIESLSKKVKELVAALAAKEAELRLKEKSEESLALAAKERTMNGMSVLKAEASTQASGDRKCECVSVLRQNSEEEITTLSMNSQGLQSSSKFGEFEEGAQTPVAVSMRRLSSSAGSTSHALPRMGSLSDLTNVDLDLDVSSMDQERLIEEWCSLRARFEKAVREIHALKKELRACQGKVDALELESSATSMCLERERRRAEADMSLMVNRVQDLTVKLSAAEKQVRQLKQKTSRVESREKRRSLSLRGARDGGRSGTDPSLGTAGRLPKEISDRLARLEATLGAIRGSAPTEPVLVKSPSLSSVAENQAATKDKDERHKVRDQVPTDGKIIVLSEVVDDKEDVRHKVSHPSSKEKDNAKNYAAANVGITSGNGGPASSGGVPTTKSQDSKAQLSSPEGGKSQTKAAEVGKSGSKKGLVVSSQSESGTKAASSTSTSEERRARAQGRRKLRLSSRLIRRGSEGDLDKQYGEPSVDEEVEEVLGVEDDSSKGCDPLRILVRLSTLEGHVADYLKTEVPSEKSPVVNCPVSSSSSSETMKNLCPNCEKMNLAMERMKKELLLEKHAIGIPVDSISSVQDGDPGMVERYREEIEQLRALCEKGMRAMDASHQRVIREMEEKHKEEVLRVHREKEQALREETKATLAALDAMRKAHETEVQREVAKFKEEFTRRMSAKQELSSQHKAEMEGIRQEILSLSQRYSSKCLECASLREQLRIASGMKSGDMALAGNLAAFGELRPGQS
ncbi:protein outspread isoform X2 [Ischnura elegans]|uniref:protein outspread isoform X2 n=1 Tax=Ischnura elegans TaxID=197161 RepID=UPI001ED8970A|nr:protein outspread isoform X2 [Ischnura elegans]